MVLNSKLYDALKYIATIVIPAIGTAYFALANQLGLHNAGKVVGILTTVDALLGALIQQSSNAHTALQAATKNATPDGEIDADTGEVVLHHADPAAKLSASSTVTLKVTKPPVGSVNLSQTPRRRPSPLPPTTEQVS